MNRGMIVALVCGAAASVSLGDDPVGQKGAAPAAFSSGPVMMLDWSAPGSWFDHPKDARLGEVLSLIPARIDELSRDRRVGIPAGVAGVLNGALPLLGRPGRVMVKYHETPTGGLYGYGVQLSFRTADAGESRRLTEILRREFRGQQRGPQLRASQRFQGMSEIQLPVGLVSFGPRDAADGSRFEIVVGTMEGPDAGLEALPRVADGTRALARGMVDFRGLTPARDLAVGLAGERGADLQQQLADLETLGLVGPSAMRMDYVVGRTPQSLVSSWRAIGAKAHAKGLGLSLTPLEPGTMRAIPANATLATLVRYADSMATDMMASLRQDAARVGDEAQIDRAIAAIRDRTGVDIERQLIAALGGTFGAYTSMASGGGGLGSMVGLWSVKDRAALGEALTKLAEFATLEMEEADVPAGRLRVQKWQRDKTDFWSLRLDGMPLPLEVTVGLTDSWVIASLSPQAAVAAVAQANGNGDAGIASLPVLKEAMGEGRGAVYMSYAATPYWLERGYTGMMMLGTLSSSSVRSPLDGSRDVMMAIPVYPELAKGVRASMGVGYWSGEDFVTESIGDPSLVVSGGATLGVLSQFTPMIAAGAAVAAQQSRGGGRFGLGDWFGVPEMAVVASEPAGPIWWAGPMAGSPRLRLALDRLGPSDVRMTWPSGEWVWPGRLGGAMIGR